MRFRWSCVRDDGLNCRTADGALLPLELVAAAMPVMRLQAVESGNLVYTFAVAVSKLDRVATVSTNVTIFAKQVTPPHPSWRAQQSSPTLGAPPHSAPRQAPGRFAAVRDGQRAPAAFTRFCECGGFDLAWPRAAVTS
jgi:hypothetical protein